MFSGLRLEEGNALLTQGDSDLDALFPKYKLVRGREKVRNDPEIAQRLMGVAYFPAHKLPGLKIALAIGRRLKRPVSILRI